MNTTHIFTIAFGDESPVTFTQNSKEALWKELDQYLRGEKKFMQFVNALLRDYQREGSPEDVQKILNIRDSAIIGEAELEELGHLDTDDLKYTYFSLEGWSYQEHKNAGANACEDLGKFKAAARRLRAKMIAKGLKISNAEALEFLSEGLFSKPYQEAKETIL